MTRNTSIGYFSIGLLHCLPPMTTLLPVTEEMVLFLALGTNFFNYLNRDFNEEKLYTVNSSISSILIGSSEIQGT